MEKKLSPDQVLATVCGIKQIRATRKPRATKKLAQTADSSQRSARRKTVVDEAVRWFIELDRQKGSPEVLRAFQQWKEKDAANGEAYGLIERDFSLARLLRPPEVKVTEVADDTERCIANPRRASPWH